MNDYPKISVMNAYEIFEDFKNDNISETKIEKYTTGKFLKDTYHSNIIETVIRIGELAENLHLDPNLFNSNFDAKASKLFFQEANIQKQWARDSDFWRWVIFTEYCYGANLVDRRYASSGDKGSAHNKYYQFGRLVDGFFSGIWMRANVIYNENDDDPLKLLEFENLNFWNYVLGGELVTYKNIIRELIKMITRYEIGEGDPQDNNIEIGYRDIFMEIRRRSSNTALDILSEEQANQFLEDLWREKKSWSINNKENI